MAAASSPSSVTIGAYDVLQESGRLSVVRRTGALGRLLGCRARPRVLVSSPDQVAGVEVVERAPRGPEVKRPWTARTFSVVIRGPGSAALGRPLRFRTHADAERMAARIQSYAGGGGPERGA